MTIKTVVLPQSTDEKVSLGFEVKLDSETDELDSVFKALAGVSGARVEYIGSKKVRADLPVKKTKPVV